MMNHPIDGTIIEARLRRSWFGQQSYEGVTIRRPDGRQAQVGRVAVAAELASAVAVGSQGRFFFHDVMGLKGMHGFKAEGEPVRSAFPRLVEDAFGALTMINLVMLASLLTLDGGLRLMPAMMAALGATLWMAFAASRQAIVHDFKFEAGLAKQSGRSAAQRPRHQLV